MSAENSGVVSEQKSAKKQNYSRKLINLDEEVNLILDQGESSEAASSSSASSSRRITRQSRKSKFIEETDASVHRNVRSLKKVEKPENSQEEEEEHTKTPKSNKQELSRTSKSQIFKDNLKTPISMKLLMEHAQETPRRSARKSVKPMLDYDDIVEKTSITKTAKLGEMGGKEINIDLEPKWTPAEVGRSSSKRSKRNKLRSIASNNKTDVGSHVKSENKIFKHVTADIELDEIADVEDKDKTDNVQVESEEEFLEKLVVEDEEMELTEEKNSLYVKVEREEQQEKIKSIEHITHKHSAVEEADDEKENAKKLIIETSSPMLNEAEAIKNFGIYLKSNTTDISDLGLNMLDAGGDVDKPESEEEMHSLIVCDDSVVDNKDINDVSIVNSTFEAMENPKMDEIIDANSVKFKSNDIDVKVVMETLNISDTDEDVLEQKQEEIISSVNTQEVLPPKIILTNELQKETVLLSTSSTCSTPTPKTTRSKPYRFPTPYKNSGNFDFRKTEYVAEKAKQQPLDMDTKNVVLRSIRKRSNSMSINTRSVKFYSPANQTFIIDDVDKIMAKTPKKANSSKDLSDIHVTKRRKRSISLDNLILKGLPSKLPKPTVANPKTVRTKLPNFAAIHQKQFNQMENLVQHFERKAERAKILTNSSSKLRTVSVQKEPSSARKISKNLIGEKPKAAKQINLFDNNAQPNNKPCAAKPDICNTENRLCDTIKKELPNPRMALIKPLVTNATTQRNPLKPTQLPKPTSSKKIVAPSQQIKKPDFNLSTAVSVQKPVDKLSARHQRHMDMFKGRTGRAGSKDETRSEIIRGVRSNRRFQLQMQHRRNVEDL